jgi:hypothetical protein
MTIAVGSTRFWWSSQSAPQSIITRAFPNRTSRALWRKWRRDLILISPRVPRKVSSMPRS